MLRWVESGLLDRDGNFHREQIIVAWPDAADVMIPGFEWTAAAAPRER